jgi:NAD(P)H dehydrogenase (quinone)
MKIFSIIIFMLFSCSRPSTKVYEVHKLPNAPQPVGNYLTYNQSGKLIFINQIALDQGMIKTPGKIDVEVSREDAKAATRQTMLNVLAVLKQALDGDLTKVKKCVQISGHFNTKDDFKDHALILNEASQILVDVFGEAGKHTRGAFGSSSLPLNSPVEIQAIFEIW